MKSLEFFAGNEIEKTSLISLKGGCRNTYHYCEAECGETYADCVETDHDPKDFVDC